MPTTWRHGRRDAVPVALGPEGPGGGVRDHVPGELPVPAGARCSAGDDPPGDPLPVGHPYVFQNDTEFCAGYFEMFFRNPHYLAALNPDLHAGYVALFVYDPRTCWPQDFPFYVEQNRAFYRSGEKLWKIGITV